MDWYDWHILRNGVRHWQFPYSVSGFASPPYLIALLPHAWLPETIGGMINLALNIAVILLVIMRLKGELLAVALAFINPAAMELLRMNNVDWLPMLGLLAPPTLGVILLSVKPHIFGGAVIVLMRKHGIRVLSPLLTLLIVSLALWGLWPIYLLRAGDHPYNFSPFPFLIPVGIYLLFKAWKDKDVPLGGLATPLLMPYLTLPSVASIMTVLACRKSKDRIWLWCILWSFFIIRLKQLQ